MHNKIIYIKEKEFYDSYTWEKASYVTYIWRIKRRNLPPEEAIRPENLPMNGDKIKEKWRKIRERDPVWIFYDRYLWDKPSYRYYREKVNAWMPLHEAIRKEKKRAEYLKQNKNKKKKIIQTVRLLTDDSNFFIEITLPKEEAKIFRKIYEEKISENEDKMLYCECDELISLMKENEQLKKELKVFNKWNPR